MQDIPKVKTAIVGIGGISGIYITNLKNLFSIVDVVGLCDHKYQTTLEACKTYGVGKAYRDLTELLADPEIELVVNLTGPAAHYDVIRQCLLAGKHVYTEKMLCFDIDQGRELLRLADERGLYLGVAPDTFLGAGLQTARKVIDTGMIGTVTSAVACINRNQLLNSELYGFIRTTGGSLPYDVGIYYLTALLSLLGPVKQVAAFSVRPENYQAQLYYLGNRGKSWDFATSNSMTASLLFESGVLGSLHFEGNSINEEQPHLVIYGTEGIAYLGDPNTFAGSVRIVRSGGGSCEIPLTHGYSGSPIYGDPTGGQLAGHGHRGLGVAEMCWSMRLGRPCRASKEMGLHAVELLRGAELASSAGEIYQMTSTFTKPAPLPSGYLSTTFGGQVRADAEASLIL